MKWLVMMFALWCAGAQATGRLPVVVAVTEDLPPLQIVEGGQLVGGKAYERVQRILELANLSVNISVLPWARTYAIARSVPNTLVFSMVRSESREEQFIWLAKLYSMDLFVISLKSRSLFLEDAAHLKKYVTGVKRGDVVTEYLQDNGFRFDEELLAVTDTESTVRMLLNERVDVIAEAPEVIDEVCVALGCSLNDFVFHFPMVELQQDFYLAASKRTDPRVIARLRAAVKKVHEERPTLGLLPL